MNILSLSFYRGIRQVVALARAGSLTRIPVRVLTDEFGFGIGRDGWNFYTDLISEYSSTPDVRLEGTRFFRFFQDPRINAVRFLDDILFLHDPDRSREGRMRFHLGTYPWGGLTKDDCLVGGTPFGWYYDSVAGTATRDLWGTGESVWYRPNDTEVLEREWEKTTGLYRAIEKGYRPLRHLSFPSVTLLVRRGGETRAIMGDGHHRLSILSCLGYEKVIVEVIQVVEETRVEDWHYVRLGQCSREQALETFGAFFETTGIERLRALGLDD